MHSRGKYNTYLSDTNWEQTLFGEHSGDPQVKELLSMNQQTFRVFMKSLKGLKRGKVSMKIVLKTRKTLAGALLLKA